MRVSIVVPSLNQGRFIERCLSSVLSQDHPDIQLIVVDGNSTDETRDVLVSFRDELSHLLIGPDDGQADALKKGFELASGDILAYLNSDDFLVQGAVTRVIELLAARPAIEAIYSDRVKVDEAGRVIGCWRLPPHNSYLMSRWDYIPQETCFWRRALFERARGIDKDLAFAMDYDLFLQFMKEGRLYHQSGFFAAFRDHDSSKTHTLNETIGKREVDQLRARHGISIRLPDRVLGRLLRHYIELRSSAYLSMNHEKLQMIVDQ